MFREKQKVLRGHPEGLSTKSTKMYDNKQFKVSPNSAFKKYPTRRFTKEQAVFIKNHILPDMVIVCRNGKLRIVNF